MNINLIAVESGRPLVESDLLAVEQLARRLTNIIVWPQARDQRGRFQTTRSEEKDDLVDLIAASEALQAFVDRCRSHSAEQPARQQ